MKCIFKIYIIKTIKNKYDIYIYIYMLKKPIIY